MSAPATSFAPPTSSAPVTAPPERPSYGTQSRQHSRSSSQLATLASLALSPRTPAAALPSSPRAGSLRPLAPLAPIDPSNSSTAHGGRGTASPRGSRRPSASSSSSSSDDERARHCRSDQSSERERTGSGSTAPSTSSADSSFAPAVDGKQARKDRRSTFPAALPTLASASASPSPISSPRDMPASNRSSGRSSPSSLPPTDPASPAHSSFPSTSTSLAQFIQHKRRQASAPYYASARSQSLFSPGAGFSLGPSSTEAGSLAATDDGARPADAVAAERATSRPRSRAASRRATAMGISLQTTGLGPPEVDGGLVVTPTTEEWRVLGSELSDLASLRAKQAQQEEAVALERRAEKEAAASQEREGRKAPKWKRWPSLTDDDDEDDDEDDNHSHFALSLSLSSLGNDKHQLPHTPPLPAAAAATAEQQPSPSSSPPLRPKPVAAYKSSFSYTSTGSGVTGGFTSHSNTSSLSRNALAPSSHTAPTSSSASSMLSAPPMVASGSEPLPGGFSSSSSSRATSTSTSPSTVSTAFQPSHRAGQKSEPSISLSSAQALAHTSRPALSRGSLSTATGVLSSPPIPHSGSTSVESGGTEVRGVGDAPEAGHAPGHDGDPTSATKHGMPHIPLPPQVLRALGEDSRAPTGLGVDGFMTPPSVAATPFDGDPFSSSAPADASLPPTPGVVDAAPSAPEPAAAGTSPSPPQQDNGAVSLDWARPSGPVDPRTYSAVTGLRDIEAFMCEDGEAGKGAYGSVRRAREKGPDGKPIGPELVVKYVIKQRILADCWKKHKILGPIPIEVHVLDHLRRVPYEPRPRLNYLSRRSGGAGGARKGPPGAHVRRDSAPQLDLWHGGKDGAPVQTGHPNVCPLLDFWEDAHYYYLVMPSATAEPTHGAQPRHGQDLFDFVDAHPDGLGPAPLQRILAQIADAVCFLHEHSIVHRDIKDENVVLDPEGNVRLIDFGSAAYVKEGRKFDTFSGTLDFAAPEVLKGARYSGKEQDIWALGVLGYVLICGECPFWSPDEAMQGLGPDTRALAALRAKERLDDGADEAAPRMSDAVDLVRRCLEIDAAERPSADAVCDHAFFVGRADGWSGSRGWERRDEGL
ncbi:hypothetical protein JCM3775_003882 [Rhodotorula graminis]